MESVMSSLIMQLNIHEFCQCAELPQTVVLEIVEHGIVEPSGPTPEQWLFDASALATVKRAFRLQAELQIEWAGVALALQLLTELEQLRAENNHLRRRLSRFEQP
jgi:chaperone modulatory protein CbpM